MVSADIICILVPFTITIFLEELGKSAIIAISSTGSQPQSEIRSKLMGQFGRSSQFMREFTVERPELNRIFLFKRAIGIPAIIHYIRVERTDTVLRQSAFHFTEGVQNIVLIDLHHKVIP